VVGALTATLGAVAIVWSLIGTPEHGWLSVRTITGFAVGIALLLVLARTEVRHPHPLIQPHLVRNGRRVGALAAMALVIGANFSMFFLVVQYDERVLGFGPFQTGLAFLPFSLGVFAMSRVTPRLLTRLGARTMVMIGTGSMVAGYAWISQLTTSSTYFGSVFGPVLIAGLATGFIFMPITATVLGGVEPEHAGSASGLLQTTQQLGGAVGVAAIVSVYATRAVPGQFVPGVEPAFLTSAAFSLLAFVVAALALRTPRAPQEVAVEFEEELVEVA
jgi:predicted MFS family arabinose efflux permease